MIRRPQISHAGFSLAYCALLFVACNAVNIDKLVRWFPARDGVDYPALLAYLGCGLGLFIAFFMLVAHPRILKPAAILIVLLSTAATYFISKYDVAIDRSMIVNAVHTDTVEVGQLLSWQMVPYVALLLILPVAVILWVQVTFQPAGRYLRASALLFAAAIGVSLVCLYANFNTISRAANVSNRYIVYSLVPVNVISGSIGAASHALAPFITSARREVPFSAEVVTARDLVVVLAVGEASRQKSFGLYGYTRRDTTPNLSKVPDLHALNGIASRGSTIDALPQILAKRGIHLVAATAKAGIPTRCFVNYTLYDNCAAVGEITNPSCGHGGKCFDEDVIPLLAEDLKSYRSGYRLEVLHLGGGSHGPIYRDRHPPEFLKFQPTCNDADVANRCSLDELYNSYDNTILYVDHVVDGILKTLDDARVPYVFIYLSDHGESLMENGVMFHGMPPGIALPPEQAQIPLLVKASVPISIARRAQYPQPDVFDTVLSLLGIRSAELDLADSFVSLEAPPAPASP
ncbi:MAG: phosphoethanolamine transferase domain-containing protein [Steroidobacteraceae bacterium]